MSVEVKVGKNPAELGVVDAQGVESLFAEVRDRFDRQISARTPDKVNYTLMRNAWMGRKSGVLTLITENWLRAAAPDLKAVVGRSLNNLRQHVEEHLEDFRAAAERAAQRDEVASATMDLTLPGYRRPLGSIHPITQVFREIEDIFLGLGFRIETGPEVESVYYNFDALNIPESHPSRDDVDTLYVDERTLLRTHTSPVQIRSMEKYGAPLYITAPGKVYRHDNPDASHSPMFHQVEGLAVDRDITFADLKGTLDFFARKFFGERIRTRFSPSYFPFTEPSGQVDISCVICNGQGCRTCKESGWLEVMGCGMVHPDVLRHGGIDPEQFTGWAFGLGVERFAMMKFGINDIQLFYQSDIRFLDQF